MTIISSSDVKEVMERLLENGFQVTKLASVGGFLKSKNVTLLSGVMDERVPLAIDIIAKACGTSKHTFGNSTVKTNTSAHINVGGANQTANYNEPSGSQSFEINVGGATIFVLNIEQTHKF